jgi:hypothetical protein
MVLRPLAETLRWDATFWWRLCRGMAATLKCIHEISSDLYLGSLIDSESDGQRTANADGDDTDTDGDDEECQQAYWAQRYRV